MRLHASNRDQRLLEKLIQEDLTLGAPGLSGDQLSVFFAKCKDGPGRFSCSVGNLLNSTKEELDPFFPSSVRSDRRKPIIVFGPMRFEVVTQVEQGTMKDFPLAQQEGN